ncbi:MAG6450 family protein [Liquorilactobacillus capillatus]|uniref:MAG6450 family protein n=1 Tax=Liquorilactobacillus capillatus TaxID=480931 RepID=UPI00070D5B2F|nr:hypothetical protein [Liquorilactobacillus capillatus]
MTKKRRGSKKSKKLTDKNKADNTRGSGLLTSKENRTVLFKFAISEKLDSGFMFKDMKYSEYKDFCNFVSITVNKGLSITEVNKLLLRTEGPHGPKNEEIFNDCKRKMFHLGKDRTKFRIHGYYNSDDYFVICRIDPKHVYKY